MTLTGKNIRPDKAKKMGLADVVCDPAALEAVAVDTAKQLAAGTLKVGVGVGVYDVVLWCVFFGTRGWTAGTAQPNHNPHQTNNQIQQTNTHTHQNH